MLQFANGLIIKGNCNVVKTKSGILINNDLGLKIEVSNKIWQSLIKNK
jgi:hypothetical protein